VVAKLGGVEKSGPAWVSGTLDFDPSEIVVAAVMRDEALRLPAFLGHYRSLGADRFIVIDNGSTDETLSTLDGQDDVTLYQINASYRDSACGIEWINQVLSEVLRGNWVVIADADEHLVYPRSETVTLAQLTEYLDFTQATALIAPLIDMYPAGSIAEVEYRRGDPLIAACSFFDADTYQFQKLEQGLKVVARGGPRDRLFWHGRNRASLPPYLLKVPLLRWSPSTALVASTHHVAGVQVSRLTGVLLHFKLLQDFAWSVTREADREEHFDYGAQYKAYLEVLAADPEASAYFNRSVRYRDSLQIVELGLMNVPDDYSSYPSIMRGKGSFVGQPTESSSSVPTGIKPRLNRGGAGH